MLIFLGVSIFVASMWRMAHLTTAAGEGDVRLALLLRGFGLGFLFTPINNVAYGNIDPKIAQQASGLINLARQLGGSFGIAILGTYLTNHTQFHRVDLIGNIYAGNPALQSRLAGLTNTFMMRGMSADAAQHVAYATIERTLMRQAQMLAYNNSWLLILITFVCAAPAILLLRKPKGGAAPAADAH